jgi:hypothetical protein
MRMFTVIKNHKGEFVVKKLCLKEMKHFASEPMTKHEARDYAKLLALMEDAKDFQPEDLEDMY